MRADFLDGLITQATALQDYGVVLNADLTVNAAKTKQERLRRKTMA